MSAGFFLTLEGGEGAGKSTQARRLAAALEARGLEVVLTREPGGAPGAEDIRKLLVTGEAARWTPLTEALLMYAARDDHLHATVRPALARGAVVIAALRRLVVGADEPDLTLVFDLPVDIGLARAATRGGDARFESKGRGYHERLRAAFLAIARREPGRCTVIDASGTEDGIAAAVLAAVAPALRAKGIAA